MSKSLDPLRKTPPDLHSVDDYKKLYAGRDPYAEPFWLAKCLPFSDGMPALCYAHGITWQTLVAGFPEVFSPEFFYDSVKGPEWPSFQTFLRQDFSDCAQDIVDEINDRSRWNLFQDLVEHEWIGKTNRHSYTIADQLQFVKSHKTRQPRRVLEIGGGLGVLSNVFNQLGVSCTSIDIAEDHESRCNMTARFYFDLEFSQVDMRTNCISEEIRNIDLAEFDTIVMVESIEHIPEPRFNTTWQVICANFSGRFIITNWLDYHPIPQTSWEHCRRVDDELYDALSVCATACWHRDRSHLVLDFK